MAIKLYSIVTQNIKVQKLKIAIYWKRVMVMVVNHTEIRLHAFRWNQSSKSFFSPRALIIDSCNWRFTDCSDIHSVR